MKIIADSHVHTTFSHDARDTAEAMVQAALERGLERICFTDHYDKDTTEWGYEEVFDPDAYFCTLSALREAYAPKIRVCAGIELGLRPYLAGYLEQLLREHPFDQVIGSVHNVMYRPQGEEQVQYTDPAAGKLFGLYDDEEGYRMMFETILENVRAFRDFDTLGHLDYVVRYGRNREEQYSYAKYGDLIDEILKLLVDGGKALEVNSGALCRGLSFAHPHADVLRRYRELGGELVTVGSDAHRTDHVAYAFDKAAELLRECGFSYYVNFEERKPVFHRL